MGDVVSISAVGAELLRGVSAFLAVLLLASGLHKAANPRRACAAAAALAGVPPAAAALLVALAACAELAAGTAMLSGHARAAGAPVAVALWSAYTALLARAILKGRRDLDCGCSFGGARHRLGLYPLARNAVLIAAAAAVAAAEVSPRPSVAQLLPALAAFAVYGALDQVLSIPVLRRAEAR